MKKAYGLPYMGSKNKIAEWVLSYLPKADNFYDLFCGGCAITHCAIENRKYNNYYINDIKVEMSQGFIDCINGKYHNDKRWISHEDFDKLKGKGDLLVDLCFSFGNNWRKGYAYSKDIEPIKKALHYAIMFDDYDMMKAQCGIDLSNIGKIGGGIYDKYLISKSIIKERLDVQSLERLERLQSLERLERLESLERLERLESLERLERLEINITPSCKSYDEIEIKPNSVIYCDIPYRNKAIYNKEQFDYDKFYDWCLKQTEPVFVSEYWMPETDFICIAEKTKTCSLNANNNSLKSIERIFIPKHQKLTQQQMKLF